MGNPFASSDELHITITQRRSGWRDTFIYVSVLCELLPSQRLIGIHLEGTEEDCRMALREMAGILEQTHRETSERSDDHLYHAKIWRRKA